jgi:hypothetical protein
MVKNCQAGINFQAKAMVLGGAGHSTLPAWLQNSERKPRIFCVLRAFGSGCCWLSKVGLALRVREPVSLMYRTAVAAPDRFAKTKS